MDTLRTKLDKLTELKGAGVITQSEYEDRRKTLVDGYLKTHDAAQGKGPVVLSGGSGGFRGRRGGRGGPRGGGYGGGFGGYGGGMMDYNLMDMWGGGLGNMYGFGMGGWGPPGRMGGRGGRGGFRGKGWMGRGGMMGRGRGMGASSTTIKAQPLPKEVTNEELAQAFTSFGEVESAVAYRGSPPYGYVNFQAADAARQAVAAGWVTLSGENVAVRFARQKKSAGPDAPPSDGIGLFNLPFTTTEEQLNDILMTFPGFQRLRLVTDRRSNQFKGYAFAYFNSVGDATFAKDNLVGIRIGEQNVDVKFASQNNEKEQPQGSKAPTAATSD